MRLHELRLHAVGPFADEQVIDFDRLSAGGLFLFEGPTGVGKSTILDALTFALYGGLASDSGDTARMHSDFAAPDQRPEVTCEFSVRGARYRVTRSPEYLRPKKRGGGTTREKSAVHLQRWEGSGWVSQSHAKDEVGTLIGELVGLNRAQFRQVVLLPQGEFATFLRADDDARRDVLVKLFGTQFFGQITAQLQACAHALGRDLAAADSALKSCLSAACEAAGMARDGVDQLLALPGELRLDRLQELGLQLSAESAVAADALQAATQAEQEVRTELATAQEQCARVARRAGIRDVLQAAQAQLPAHAERSRRLTLARRALPVRPLLQIADSCQAALADLRAQVAAVRAVGPDSGTGSGSGTGTEGREHLLGVAEALDGLDSADRLLERAQRLRSAASGLVHLVEREQGLAEQDRALASDLQALKSLESARATAATLARELPDQVEQARAEVERAKVQVERAVGAAGLLVGAQRQSLAAGRVAELARGLQGAAQGARAAKRAARTAAEEHELLLAARMSDLRIEIAGQLVSGDPCGVCGSIEHPAPASGAAGGVSGELVRVAAAQRDEAQHLLDEADRLVIQLEAQLGSARSESDGRSVQEWAETCAEHALLVAAGSQAQESLPTLTAELDRLVTAAQSAAEGGLALAGQVAALAASVEAARARADSEATAVRQACDGFPSVADRVSQLSLSAQQCAAVGHALAEVERAATHHAQALERALCEAVTAGFADLGHARTAILEPDELTALEESVAQFESAMATARVQLAEPDLLAVAGLDPVDTQARVEAAAQALGAATSAAGSARSEHSVAARKAERFATRLQEVQSSQNEQSALAEAAEQARTLDQYARGMAGSPRMSLVTFVLRYWFEQVVAAANLRLDEMSAGKYELVRTDDGSRRDSRVGLGLSVLDRHTGKERSPGTLSGGETFYTSLSLALGLTDVVVAQAGGAELDTLFIDEGFGSLDADTLDDVMAVIDDLRGNGRVVGIVSHVPDLKERISERLTIRRVRRDGPSVVEVLA